MFNLTYGGLLYDFMGGIPEGGGASCTGVTAAKYIEAGLALLHPPTSTAIDTYFNIFSGSKKCITKQGIANMFQIKTVLCIFKKYEIHFIIDIETLLFQARSQMYGVLGIKILLFWESSNCIKLHKVGIETTYIQTSLLTKSLIHTLQGSKIMIRKLVVRGQLKLQIWLLSSFPSSSFCSLLYVCGTSSHTVVFIGKRKIT